MRSQSSGDLREAKPATEDISMMFQSQMRSQSSGDTKPYKHIAGSIVVSIADAKPILWRHDSGKVSHNCSMRVSIADAKPILWRLLSKSLSRIVIEVSIADAKPILWRRNRRISFSAYEVSSQMRSQSSGDCWHTVAVSANSTFQSQMRSQSSGDCLYLQYNGKITLFQSQMRSQSSGDLKQLWQQKPIYTEFQSQMRSQSSGDIRGQSYEPNHLKFQSQMRSQSSGDFDWEVGIQKVTKRFNRRCEANPLAT